VASAGLAPAAGISLDERPGQHEAEAGESLCDPLELLLLLRPGSHLLSFAARVRHVGHFREYIYCMTSDVLRAISGFRARTVPSEAARFAKQVTLESDPPSAQRARALLFATSKLGAFGISVGLELTPGVIFHPSVIERFCLSGCQSMSSGSVRTIRTNLRFVADRVLETGPRPVALPRERAKAPYSDKEIDSYLRLADSQPTEARRNHAAALICLGAGAGLVGADLRSVQGTDICCRSGGVLVCVSATRPRCVPVATRFHDRLLVSADFAGHSYVIGGLEAGRKNVTTPIISDLSGGTDLERLSVRRLRATWLTSCASALGLRAFMDAAGVDCSQRLGDIVSHLEPEDEQSAVKLLGAAR
jgi:hypothetical protein